MGPGLDPKLDPKFSSTALTGWAAPGEFPCNLVELSRLVLLQGPLDQCLSPALTCPAGPKVVATLDKDTQGWDTAPGLGLAGRALPLRLAPQESS